MCRCLQDLGLYDDQLTVGKVLEILCAESPDPRAMACFNLDLEITFLEFFEALLGCAEVKWSSWVEVRSEGPAEREGALTGRGGADSEMDQWVDAVHCFFSGTLFPAYERRALLHREAGAERLRRAAADRIALAKAQRAARLRELCKEEEERREEEDEEEVERADAPEEDPHPSQSLAFPIPAASSTCITNPTPPHSASGTRSRR
ncbi:hypothetical protein JZ751_010720 [Albula glossodonta]|uniref:Uncharacterized protein n=1 Tax=Albula glossodonta TaxID=121402 RepID=A0A8T2N534_9TELE|nr:hypothetical protein JZ751_010720 [Albula glossodonta]